MIDRSAPAHPAYRNEPPRDPRRLAFIGLWLALLGALFALGATGCVKSAVHESAVALQRDLATYRRATVPNPAYGEADAAKVDALGKKCAEHVDEIEEASR